MGLPRGALEVASLSKSFPLGGRQPSLRERLAGKRPAPRERAQVLDDLSFRLEPGEIVGVIGRNGAGKSTLLKLLAGIYSPDSGTSRLGGRVASLLELGAGFHPDLTGLENVYLNGSLLGMGREEIERKVEGILAFSELERFAGSLVKTYSAGMVLRLAFAVAVSLDPDIFLLDEIIGVGDLAFQQKCFGRILELKAEGKTILFVSHNLSIMRYFAEKVMWLEDGRLEGMGDKHRVLEQYRERLSASAGDITRLAGGGRRFGDGPLAIDDVRFVGPDGGETHLFRYGEPMVVEVEVRARANAPSETAIVGLVFHGDQGQDLIGPIFNTVAVPGQGPWAYRYTIPRLPFLRREFFVTAAVYDGESFSSPSDQREKAYRFSVLDTGERTTMGLIDPGGTWEGPL